ncbi:MAG TPA: glycosyltransferase family 4 protein [Verrucomicrobiae bacterium]|jgi:glycosyltransferase involved in cell wall biosynthesis
MFDKTPLRVLAAGVNWNRETFLRRLVEGLAEAGVFVTVATPHRPVGMPARVAWLPTPSWDSNRVTRLARLAVLAARASLFRTRDVKVFAKSLRGVASLAERLRQWNQLLPYAGGRWDVIYFPWNSLAIGCLPVFDLGCPVVVSCRGTQASVAPHNPERQQLREGLRATFQRAAAVHCVSQATLRDACDFGLDAAKARIIRPAVEPALFCPPLGTRPDSGEFSVVATGSLVWLKGHEWALQAIRQVANGGINVRFDIIGDGPGRQRVLYTIADLGLKDRVRCLGWLAPDEVLRRVQTADAFLLSSLSEGISNAALEAMACGVPVVTTDCGGMPEAVADGVEGYVVPARDAGALAAALMKLARDASKRRRMGEAARARVERDFSLKRQIEQWLELFSQARRMAPPS